MTFQDMSHKEQVRWVMKCLRRHHDYHRLVNTLELVKWILEVGPRKIQKLVTEIENETA